MNSSIGTGMSKIAKLGVIGDPIEHSLSPFIHSRFARLTNINIEYLPYKVNEDEFKSFVKDFFKDPTSKGLNITLPHKKLATKIDGIISKEASYINAVNTLVKDDKKIFLYSTDGEGFFDDVKQKGFDFTNKRILVMGAGAAVESILYRIANSDVKSITIFNRTVETAEKLARKYSHMKEVDTVLSRDNKYDIVINGSSAGLTGEFKPTNDFLISNNAIFYDLNYSLAETPFCKWASDKSNHVFDGIGMLVFQAAHSYKMWFGVFPETKTVLADLEAMRE